MPNLKSFDESSRSAVICGLLELPCKREPVLLPRWKSQEINSGTIQNITACLIKTTGAVPDKPCTCCLEGKGIWT